MAICWPDVNCPQFHFPKLYIKLVWGEIHTQSILLFPLFRPCEQLLYASMVLAMRWCIYHKLVSNVWKRLNVYSSFFAQRFHSTYPTMCYTEIRVSKKLCYFHLKFCLNLCGLNMVHRPSQMLSAEVSRRFITIDIHLCIQLMNMMHSNVHICLQSLRFLRHPV